MFAYILPIPLLVSVSVLVLHFIDRFWSQTFGTYSWQECNCNNATSLKRKHLRWIFSPFPLGFPWLHSLCVMIYLFPLQMSRVHHCGDSVIHRQNIAQINTRLYQTSSVQFALNSLRIEKKKKKPPQASLVLPHYRIVRPHNRAMDCGRRDCINI